MYGCCVMDKLRAGSWVSVISFIINIRFIWRVNHNKITSRVNEGITLLNYTTISWKSIRHPPPTFIISSYLIFFYVFQNSLFRLFCKLIWCVLGFFLAVGLCLGDFIMVFCFFTPTKINFNSLIFSGLKRRLNFCENIEENNHDFDAWWKLYSSTHIRGIYGCNIVPFFSFDAICKKMKYLMMHLFDMPKYSSLWPLATVVPTTIHN